MNPEKSYKVLYTKDGQKKRKAYQDGSFSVKKNVNDSCLFTLFDEYGKEVKKVTEKMTKFNVKIGGEFVFGSFEVQVEEIINGTTPSDINVSTVIPIPTKKPFAKFSSSASDQNSAVSFPMHKSLSGSIAAPKKLAPVMAATLDASVSKVMRPHQIEGANFLLRRLIDGDKLDGDISGEKGQEDRCKGAILADEMGLGKTLTAISVLWAFVRQGGCKGVVVCPSSLVDNWEREMKQWLGVKMRPLVLRPGMNAETTINSFVIGHVSLTPVMLLSYEMFRKHAVQLNTVPHLDVLVCDEGHRLKNVGGTKTIQALSQCKARRRIVLSGTPVQNDLDELFAVVSFVQPGFLGSLPDFKQRISGPIVRASEPDASEWDREEGDAASQRLRELMGRLMLRRTQSDILSKSLPPRTDYVVYCRLTQWQQAEYDATVTRINGSIGYLSAAAEADDEAEEEDTSLLNSAVVLPGLQQLRKTCIFAAASPSEGTKGVFSIASTSLPSSNSSSSFGGKLPDLLNSSTKFQFLAGLVSALQAHAHSSGGTVEKLVVVSNFTSTLDQVQSLAAMRGWGDVLRIDGQVPVDRRQGLVDAFNRASDKRIVFLLSSKAGGVGINLIGGSRLVMLDPDWNPATDKQAMSRIWREGQKRPVFVYRLVALGRIEDAILNRQYAKSDLASALTALDAAESDGSSLLTVKGKGQSGGKMSLTRKDLQRLMLPLDVRSLATSDETEEGNEGNGDYSEEQEALSSDPVLRLTVERLRTAQRADCAGVVARVEKRSAEFY